MGIIVRIFGWLWRRAGDTSTAVDILDLFDLKTAAIAAITFVAMMIYGATNFDWSQQTVVVVAIVVAASVAIIYIAIRVWVRTPQNSPQAKAAIAPRSLTSEEKGRRAGALRAIYSVLDKFPDAGVSADALVREFLEGGLKQVFDYMNSTNTKTIDIAREISEEIDLQIVNYPRLVEFLNPSTAIVNKADFRAGLLRLTRYHQGELNRYEHGETRKKHLRENLKLWIKHHVDFTAWVRGTKLRIVNELKVLGD